MIEEAKLSIAIAEKNIANKLRHKLKQMEDLLFKQRKLVMRLGINC